MSVSLTNVARWVLQNFYTKTQLTAGTMDTRYFAESEFITTSAGAGDVGKPIKLDAGGHIDATMINDADIDHTSIANIGTNTHAQIDTHIAATAAHGATGAVVGTTNSQTLTNKTLSSPAFSGTVTSGIVVGTLATPGISAGGISLGDAAVDYSPTVGNYNSSGSTLLLSGLNHSTIGFLDSGSRVDFIRVGAGTITLGYDGGSGVAAVAVPGSLTVGGVTVVTTTASQTLTNKTLTTPVISSISNTGTLTLPTSTDTLVGRATTDTLTNKTLTTPTIVSTGWTNANHAHQAANSGGTLDHGLAMTGLTDDDHTQYLLLAGRSGGQTFYGDTAANGDLVIHGTSSATKTSSYVSIQPSGGDMVVGGSTTDHNFEVQDAGASSYRVTFNLNSSGTNYFNSYNGAVGNLTGAPLAIVASTLTFSGMDSIRIESSKTPASNAAGSAGMIAWDTGFLYVCTAANTWERVALTGGY